MNAQLPLALRWPSWSRFEFFDAEGADEGVVPSLELAAADPAAPWTFVTGPAGCGKTHLLVATCHAATECGRRAQYISAAEFRIDVQRLRTLGGSDLLAIDDLQCLAGDAAAEHALFDLYNRCRAESATMLFAATESAVALPLGLADLRSRLAACAQGRVRVLAEPARHAILKQRAEARGIELDAAALDWLFTYHARDIGSLVALLERIDQASLAARRRVTVPFLRDLLGGS